MTDVNYIVLLIELMRVFIPVIGREMLHEKSKEIDGLNKEFQRQIQVLVEDHKKEVDVSI